jgi:hypothetical protein
MNLFPKRFFAFGCSFTKYYWPTWADIIGSNFQQYYNYGHQGVSNKFIFATVIQAIHEHNINNNDVVMICWTGSERLDLLLKDYWTIGIQRKNEYYDFFDYKGILLDTLLYMSILKKYFDAMQTPHHYLIIDDFSKHTKLNEIYNRHDILEFFKDSYSNINELKIDDNRPFTFDNISITDAHPLPWEHYNLLVKNYPSYLINIPKNFDKKLKDSFVNNYDKSIVDYNEQLLSLREKQWPVEIIRNTSLTFPVKFKPIIRNENV